MKAPAVAGAKGARQCFDLVFIDAAMKAPAVAGAKNQYRYLRIGPPYVPQ